ncbi:epoxide hydrolase 4-like isoform X2 [Amblyomma americanum]
MPLVATLRRAFTTLLLVIIGATRSAILLVHIALLVLLKGRRVLKPRERAQEPECLQDPALGGHDFITIEDATLHYVSAGKREKPLVLLLHGFPDFWFSWKHQILGLKSDFWVVALDLRGYGRSSKSDRVVDYRGSRLVEDVHQLIISLGKRKANIVAHDWGAVIAWWLATKYENLVDKLVIINGPHPLAMKYQLEHSLSQILRSWYLVTFQLPWLPETCFCMNDMKLLDTLLGAYDEEEREAMKYSFSKPVQLKFIERFHLPNRDHPGCFRVAPSFLRTWLNIRLTGLCGNRHRPASGSHPRRQRLLRLGRGTTL